MNGIPLRVSALLLTASLSAQNVLHYKFDERCGAEVVNFAAGSAVGNAGIVTTLPGGVDAARVTGQFDLALGATAFPGATPTTRLNTGWAPSSPTGNLSFGLWIRNQPGNPAAISFGYLFGATGGNFRLFTGSSGRMFLAGAPFSATSAVDLTPLLNAGWVHIACTLSSSPLQAIWYVNGVPDPTIVPTQALALAGTNFAIGARDTGGSSPSPLQTDEFVMSHSVWTPAEVLALAQATPAADGAYSSGIASQCGAGNVVLGSAGGTPAIGNLAYSLTVSTTTPSLFVLLAGFDKCFFGGVVPLPLDGTPLLPQLNGCWILADAPVTLSGVNQAGTAALALPIPVGVPASTHIYTQALALDLATFAGSMSSGFVSSTGQ